MTTWLGTRAGNSEGKFSLNKGPLWNRSALEGLQSIPKPGLDKQIAEDWFGFLYSQRLVIKVGGPGVQSQHQLLMSLGLMWAT